MDYMEKMETTEAAQVEQPKTLEELEKKYAGTKMYRITNSVQVDDETEEEYTFIFKKPTPASYDRYLKMVRTSSVKAGRAFALDCIVPEQKEALREALEEYPAMILSIMNKMLVILGYSDEAAIKKL